jgi:5-methylcytosine-specific restriction endonuclease McrA
MTKICNKCLKELDISCFHKAGVSERTGKQFYKPNCRDCTKLSTKDYYDRNAEKIKKRSRIDSKIRRGNNPEYMREYLKEYAKDNAGELKAYKNEYYLKNKEKIAERAKLYRDTHKEEKRLQDKRYRDQNKEKIKEQKHLSVLVRRTKMKNTEASLIKEDWQKIIKFFDNKCAYCGNDTQKLTLDHFVPVSMGGELTVNNSIPACKQCNQSKSDKNFFVWYPLYKHFDKNRFKKVVKFLDYDLKTKSQQLRLAI